MYRLRVNRDSRPEQMLGGKLATTYLRELQFGRPPRWQVIEPEFDAVFERVWGHADSPEVARAVRVARRAERAVACAAARSRLDAALAIEVSNATIAHVVSELVAIDVALLEPEDRLRRVLLADTVSGWAQANATATLADYVGRSAHPDSDAAAEARRDRALRLEVRVARNISDTAAALDIEAARRLASDLRPVREAWSRGHVSFRHVAAFLDRTRLCSPELTTAVLDRIGDRLTSTPSTRVGKLITGALAAIDPAGQAARARHARKHEVGVTQRTLADGLGQITVIDKVEVTRAMIERIDDDADQIFAHSQTCDPCAEDIPAEIGPCRAAAFRGLFFAHDATGTTGAGTQDTLVVDYATGLIFEPTATASTAADTAVVKTPDAAVAPASRRRKSRRGELQVVIDLATLLGLADNPALLAGQPVPAALARELATECGSLRRIVTDPVDGHLLDYGTRTYLPKALKVHIAARDGTCRAPGCNQPANRCELDHIDPFPHGPSAVGNTHMFCTRDHTIKTDGDLTVLDHHPNGTTTWRTRDGQTGVTPPRPYLPETPRESGATHPTDPPDDDPIPF